MAAMMAIHTLHRLQAETHEVSVHTCACMCPIAEQSYKAVQGPLKLNLCHRSEVCGTAVLAPR